MNAVALDTPFDFLIQRELPAAAGGDRDAYSRIVAASQNSITAIALAITRDVATSEDIAQEAFLSAWQNLRKLQNSSSFMPWLRQITRNLARDHLRSRGRLPREVADAEDAIAAAADPQLSPCEQLIDDERQHAAAELISALPDESREVLLLYYREGQSSQQVARLLGLTDAAVRKRLSRARSSVREDLLKRFAEFARSSAPSAAFAASVFTMLGTVSKPAAAAGFATAGGVVASTAAKSTLGMLGSVIIGPLAGLAAGYYGWCLLLTFTETEQERAALGRFMRMYLLSAIVPLGLLMAYMMLSQGWMLVIGAAIAATALTYPILGPLAKMMKPLIARDAAKYPATAARRQMIYRLSWGSSGVIISLCGLVFGVAMALMK